MGRRFKKSLVIQTDMKEGNVKIFVDGKKIEVASADFCFDDTQIRVTNVATSDAYKKTGYGKLLFDVLKCVSKQSKKPLILWALEGAIPFYEKIGMLHLEDPEVQKLVILGNGGKCESKQCTQEGCEDLWKSKVDNDDFIWIPQGLKVRPIIYL